MASRIESRRLSRRLLVGFPLILVAGAARGQEGELTYPRSSIVIAARGRDLNFEVELALDDAHRSHALRFRTAPGPYEGTLFSSSQESRATLSRTSTRSS